MSGQITYTIYAFHEVRTFQGVFACRNYLESLPRDSEVALQVKSGPIKAIRIKHTSEGKFNGYDYLENEA